MKKFEKIVGKGENPGNFIFSISHIVFYHIKDKLYTFNKDDIGLCMYIHAIIFSDKSGTMDFIFKSAFSGTETTPPVQNSKKKSYNSTDDVKFLTFLLLILVKLHDFV